MIKKIIEYSWKVHIRLGDKAEVKSTRTFQ
jgi:hypothetical protein